MIERVIYPFRGAELGGSHIATFTLAQALQQQHGVACVILCPEGTLIMEKAHQAGLGVVASGEAPTGQNNAFTDLFWAAKRRRLLEEASSGASTVVHCNDINTLRSWGLAGRIAGFAVAYHHHALNRMWWPPHLVSLAYANAVLCVSDSTREAMLRWRSDAIKELNPFILDLGCDRLAARAALLKEFSWKPDSRVIGWIGNFWERKRPLFFLETAAAIARRETRCRFAMFGRDGDHTAEAIRQKARELGIGDKVALPGFRQPPEANLACLDVLLAPAPREPFGRALVEAILLGTPVVATRGAGHSEILNNWGGGVLVNENLTAEQVAELSLATLANAEQVRLPLDERRAIAAELDASAHAKRVLDIYQRIERRRPTTAAGMKPSAARN